MFHQAGKEEVYITEGEQQVKIFKTYKSSKLFPYTSELKFNTINSYPFVKSSTRNFYQI